MNRACNRLARSSYQIKKYMDGFLLSMAVNIWGLWVKRRRNGGFRVCRMIIRRFIIKNEFVIDADSELK